MESYDALVKRKADEKSTDVIPNADIPHATVLVENLLSHAGSTCRIFTGTLNNKVYGSPRVLAAAENFLARKGKLEILIENPPGDILEHPLVLKCKSEANDCDLRKVVSVDDDLKCNFIVADGTAWRFEPDKNVPAAVGCFNDPDAGKKLEDVFAAIFPRGKKL